MAVEICPPMRRVILESPYAGTSLIFGWFQRWLNRCYARRCVRDSLLRGEAPIASHLLYTQPGILRDGIQDERRHGIKAGLAWGGVANATVVYTDRGTSNGMMQGIMAASRCGRPVEYRSLSAETKPAVRRCRCGRLPADMRDCPQFNAHGLPTSGRPEGSPAGECIHYRKAAQ